LSASPEPTEDGELLRLLDEYCRDWCVAGDGGDCRPMYASLAALLAYIAAHYVRRDRLPLTDARATFTMRTSFASADDEIPFPPKPVAFHIDRTVDGVTTRLATVGPDTPNWTDTVPVDGEPVATPEAHGDADRSPPSPPGSYKAARGILPWRPGDELPEDAIRRLRNGE
jgi:hypothetical protein